MNRTAKKWLLPDGVEELLPEQAWQMEKKRRQIIDVFRLNGYQLVKPPMLEFIESLMTGSGSDLDLLTYKVLDHQTGRMMGIRADMTPQLSRIDAHVLNANNPVRLCYIGSVIQSEYRSGFHSREPVQFGGELFGEQSAKADIQIIKLASDILSKLGFNRLQLDLGHIGVFNAIVEDCGLNNEQKNKLLDICNRKSMPDMAMFSEQIGVKDESRQILNQLLNLNGDVSTVLSRADAVFKTSSDFVKDKLKRFNSLIKLASEYLPELKITIDMSELRGINYHTGLMFSIYSPSCPHALAKGGRYDEVGAEFGRSRAATGFSADLRQCMTIEKNETSEKEQELILAPFRVDSKLNEYIVQLRAEGKNVMIGLNDLDIGSCTHRLVESKNKWHIERLT